MPTAQQVVDDWHRVLGHQDRDALMALMAPGVEMSGPRGQRVGDPGDVRDWIERSGIRIEPRRSYARGDAVVVEQAARWPRPDGEGLTDPQTVFTAFQVAEGRITRLLRFDALAPALAVSALTERDLVP